MPSKICILNLLCHRRQKYLTCPYYKEKIDDSIGLLLEISSAQFWEWCLLTSGSRNGQSRDWTSSRQTSWPTVAIVDTLSIIHSCNQPKIIETLFSKSKWSHFLRPQSHTFHQKFFTSRVFSPSPRITHQLFIPFIVKSGELQKQQGLYLTVSTLKSIVSQLTDSCRGRSTFNTILQKFQC